MECCGWPHIGLHFIKVNRNTEICFNFSVPLLGGRLVTFIYTFVLHGCIFFNIKMCFQSSLALKSIGLFSQLQANGVSENKERSHNFCSCSSKYGEDWVMCQQRKNMPKNPKWRTGFSDPNGRGLNLLNLLHPRNTLCKNR